MTAHVGVAPSVEVLLRTWERHELAFSAVTQGAPVRFSDCDWQGMQRDAVLRLGMYGEAVGSAHAAVTEVLAGDADDRAVWQAMKAAFARRVAGRTEPDLAETFFNSVTRRVFHTVGVDPAIEFVSAGAERAIDGDGARLRIEVAGDLSRTLPHLVEAAGLDVRWRDLGADLAIVAERFAAHPTPDAIELLAQPCFRGAGAYLVGRLVTRDGDARPFAFAIRNSPDGAWIDALLESERDVSVLFSYTRAYFHCGHPRPSEVIGFLRGVIPRKRVAELFITLGFVKHGKTVLYRDLADHIADTDDRFVRARGMPGMVMVAFGFPHQDLIFKVIRDTFPPQKRTSRRQVMERYGVVSQHDRAGRLIDAWEFEHLTFDRSRFTPELLGELLAAASRSVEVRGDQVVLHHAYLERRVTPLDVFIRSAGPEAARAAVLDWGGAIKDLARSNIFPGDMLLKNFGVTRSGRVVFYDYDELTTLDAVSFRNMPAARNDDEELSAEPWFGVAHDDVFPEELPNFLGLSPDLRRVFEQAHGDLFTVEFWTALQHHAGSGLAVEILPYPPERRLYPSRPTTG